MLKINEFAKLCGVSVHTLRYYDKCNILCPRETDPSSGYRYYHPEQKQDMETVLTLKDLGFSLEDIRTYMNGTTAVRRLMLGIRKQYLHQEICALQENIKKIDQFSEDKNLGYYHFGTSFLDLPFEDDPCVIGRWDYCGYHTDHTKFTSEEDLCHDEHAPSTMFLLPGGERVWTYAWSKNVIYQSLPDINLIVPNPYTLFSVGQNTYMSVRFAFEEFRSGSDKSVNRIFRQIDTNTYTQDSAIMFRDDLSLPYLPDPRVIGYWKTVDMIDTPDQFKPEKKHFDHPYMYEGIRFSENGNAHLICFSTHGLINLPCQYTNGCVITESYAQHYAIKQIKNTDYLFMEHKSGDYAHLGKFCYYVFRREEIVTKIQSII